MIKLHTTSYKLQIVLSGAITTNQLKVSVYYYDENPQQTNNETRGATQVATTNNTTDVDICDAPKANNITRNIESIVVYNRDTVNATPTIKLDNGGTETELVKRTLAAGETLFYEHGSGWGII